MKLRPILVLLLFVVSGCILVWLYYTASRGHTRRKQESPWTETIADLGTCCGRKHAKAAQYDHFAGIADGENRRRAARLFRAMALAERLQENNCANALVRLGGSYNPPTKVVVFRGTTDDNLARSIDYELRTVREQEGAEISRALEKGNRYAARMLIWAASGDMRHAVLMEQCRGRDDTTRYLLCPVCGNLYEGAYCDPYCPQCLTSGERFIRVE